MSVEIHPETEEDISSIRDVNRRAFARDEEARLVDDLRDGGYATLSLIAEKGGRIVGHIMISRAVIHTRGGETEALALGPVAVLPERQGRGTGSGLVRESLGRCSEAGHRIVVLLGHPGFYPRFGFSAERAANLDSEYSGAAFMALELAPGALSGVTGDFHFAPPFEAVS